MVLKPQILDLFKKQFLFEKGKIAGRESHLMLAVLHVRKNQLFLTDGIKVIATKKQKFISTKLKLEKDQKIKITEMQGFVCLFKNCRFELFEGNTFERLSDEILNHLEISDTQDEQTGFEKSNNLSNLHSGNHETNKLIKDKKKKYSKFKNNKIIRLKNYKKSKEEDYVTNLFLDFDSFNIVCPFGGYFLRNNLQMFMDSLTEPQLVILNQNKKIDKYITKIKSGGVKDTTIIDISNILLVGFKRKMSEDIIDGTATSTPSNYKQSKNSKKKKRYKFKKKAQTQIN